MTWPCDGKQFCLLPSYHLVPTLPKLSLSLPPSQCLYRPALRLHLLHHQPGQRIDKHERIMEGLNITEEMLSPDSVTRQLNDQISLAKAFVVIAKESNNLQFAWELSAQIRNSQILLSNVATRLAPLTTVESESAIHDMALLLYQAQQLHYDSAKLHYDSATMIMRFKAKIQALEELLKLTVLDLSFNKITTTKALGQLVANYNSLQALNLLGNPIQSNISNDQLRKAVFGLLPKLVYLNNTVQEHMH
ncbi:hypothetical protein RIF29_25864 [Crotalaria pallida]|uniref:Uncharacterized protein n=1 Tax=Crotalaria pallida TaxID=3830 RepID=A0AAN9EN02_CROPI